MNVPDALALARQLKARGPLSPQASPYRHALLALLDHGDKVQCPDMDTCIRMVAAHIHERGKFYIEIAVDPQTKEVASTFEPTPPDNPGTN